MTTMRSTSRGAADRRSTIGRALRAPAVLALLAILAVAAPADAAARDRTRPSARLVTQDGAILVGAPVETDATVVRGRASDASGIRSVSVSYCTGGREWHGGWVCSSFPVGGFWTKPARLRCVRTACDFTAPVPTHPGRYIAYAKATDRAGNVRYTPIIELVIL